MPSVNYFSTPAMPGSAFLSPIEEWEAYEHEALELVKGRVLDVGCGAGRHSLHLQNKGHEVVAIDSSPGAVDVARVRGVHDVRLLDLMEMSPGLGKFDSVLMMCGNFGLFGDREGARRGLTALWQVTNGGAIVLADTVDPHQTEQSGHQHYFRQNIDRGRMPGQVRIRISYGAIATPWFDLLNVSREEMVEVIDGTGWKVERFIPDEGQSYVGVLVRT